LSMHCLLLFISLPFTTADYFIDDTSSNITYTPSSGPGNWGRGSLTSPLALFSDTNSSLDVIDYTRLYGNTLAYSEYNGTGLSQMEIHFSGSGITIYGIQMDTGPNFSVSIDDIPLPSNVAFPALPPRSPTIYNMSFYDKQSLSASYHTLTITNNGEMTFDYAYINETAPFLTSSKTSSSGSSIPVKIVAGAVVGGLMAAAVVIGCFLCWSRKRARPMETPSQSYITSSHSPDVRQWSMPIDPLADEQPLHTQSDVPAISFAVGSILQEGGIPGARSTSSVRRGNTRATMPPSYKE